MKLCIRCKKRKVANPDHDLCRACWAKKELRDDNKHKEDHFESNLSSNRIHTAYIMFYGKNQKKIGYTSDLHSRRIEIKRQYPNNKLVYFREFMTESNARRFEAWLKTLTDRELYKFVSTFQDKIKKVEDI